MLKSYKVQINGRVDTSSKEGLYVFVDNGLVDNSQRKGVLFSHFRRSVKYILF
jgi:hypothetical protein